MKDNEQKSGGQQQNQQGQQRLQEQQQQRQGGGGSADLSLVREHMDVVGPDGAKVGTVDKVEGNRIKLTKDSSGDGQHRYIEVSAVAGIDGGKVRVSTKGGSSVSGG
jgi:hypothetical protein